MTETTDKYISIQDLKNGYIYKIKARNANYGVWIKEKSSFMISRWKFKSNYLFLEIHWDEDEQYGTAKPIETLYKFIFEIKEINNYNGSEAKKILIYLDSLDDSLKNVIHKSFGEIQK